MVGSWWSAVVAGRCSLTFSELHRIVSGRDLPSAPFDRFATSSKSVPNLLAAHGQLQPFLAVVFGLGPFIAVHVRPTLTVSATPGLVVVLVVCLCDRLVGLWVGGLPDWWLAWWWVGGLAGCLAVQGGDQCRCGWSVSASACWLVVSRGARHSGRWDFVVCS